MATAKGKGRVVREGDELDAHLAGEALAPIYLVTSGSVDDGRRSREEPPSADPWALAAVVRTIEAAALRGGDPALDLVRVDYVDGDHSGDGVHALIAGEARSMSLFGGRRVISVSHCEALDYGGSGRRRKADAGDDALERLVEALPEAGPAPFVLILSAGRFDRRKKAFKDLAARGVEVAVAPMDPGRLQSYLEWQAREFSIRVDRGVGQRIWDRLGGGEPARLRQTADRLLLDVGRGGHVTTRLVEDVVPVDREAAVWAITDAIADADIARGLAVLHLLLEHEQEPIAIAAALASSVRSQLRVAEGLAQRMSPDAIAAATKMHPYRTKLLAGQVAKLRPGQLEAAVRTCAELDLVLRATAMGDRKAATARWLEAAIVALCRGAALRTPQAPSVSRAL